MDSNLVKCFICDVTCVAKSVNFGANIARTLTMPLISVLTKCLRTFVEVENEYFCCECTNKIEEYDNLARLSLQIETELYRQFQNKPFKSSFLDDELFVDQSEIRDFLDNGRNEKITTSSSQTSGIDLSSKSKPQSNNNDLNSETVNEITTSQKVGEDYNPEINENSTEPDSIETLEQCEPNDENEPMEKSIIYDADEERQAEIARFIARIKAKKKPGRKCKQPPPTSTQTMKLKDWKIPSEGPLTCDICGRSYKTKGALGVHMVKHSDSNPHGN